METVTKECHLVLYREVHHNLSMTGFVNNLERVDRNTCTSTFINSQQFCHVIITIILSYFTFQIVINKHKAFVRFGLTHIVATNICIWALATVIEIDEAYETRENAVKDGLGLGGRKQEF